MSKFFDHKIKYRTLDQLIASVSDDWMGYDSENLVDPSQLIKIVRKINKQLGLRVTKTKEVMIDFSNWVANLPDDLENLNFAVLCAYVKTTVPAIQGTITEHIDVDSSTGNCETVFLTECGDGFQIIQKILPNLEKVYDIERRVKISHSLYQVQDGEVVGVILSDNFMRLTVPSGKLYLNYEGILEDSDGNLLVVDHPMINDYYEYALKERILENMFFNGEDVERKLAYIQPKLQQAKREAYGVSNMPEFKEIEEVIKLNREAMYKKYFSRFI